MAYIVDQNSVDLRYGATYGIVDIFSPWTPSGEPVSGWFEEFTIYLKNTLKWSVDFPCRTNEGTHSGHHGYRILDTFMSEAFEASFLRQLLQQTDAVERSPVKFLLMDPVGSLAAARSRSLEGDPMARGRDGLTLLYKAMCSFTKGLLGSDAPPMESADKLSMRELASEINRLGEPHEIEIRFHNVFASGISYFFKDVLIRGSTPAMQSSLDGMWDRIVNDPSRGRDRYDQYSLEFNQLWDQAERLPGEDSGDPNSVFISYRREDAELVGRLKEYLEAPGQNAAGEDVELKVFWDQHIRVGDTWKEKIRQALNSSGTMVVIVGEVPLGQWVLAEVGHFWAASKKIIPVLHGIDAEQLPDLIEDSQAMALSTDDSAHEQLFEELRAVLLEKALPSQEVR